MFNTIGPSFTLKWRPPSNFAGVGSFSNSDYRDTNFNYISGTTPTWPPRDIWNNVWYNSTPEYYANSGYDIYQNNVSNQNYYNYTQFTVAEQYMYRRNVYECCWCGCPDGYYDAGQRWGQFGECGRCFQDLYSSYWWYNYANYRSYNVYNRYRYIDHNQGLVYQATIYKDYSESNGNYISRSQVNN